MPPKKSAAKNSEASAASTSPRADKARLFLVYGSDDLSATRKADEIVACLCPPEEQAFGLETIQPESGEKLSDTVCAILRNTMEALMTPTFLGGNKTVYLRGAPFFNPLTEPGKFEAVKTEITRLVDLLKAGLPEGVSFLVLTDSVNKSTSFFKTFQSQGEVHAFDEPEKPKEASVDFIPLVKKLLDETGLAMPPDVFSCFLDRTGYSLRQVEAEIEKLSLYLGDRKTATLADVQLMVAPVREGNFWDYADAFCKGNLAATLQVMQRLFTHGESPVGLIVSLQNRLRDIVVLSDCLKRGWAHVSSGDWPKLSWSLPPEGEALLSSLEKDPRKGNPYAIAMMASQANRLPPARWFRWLNAAVDAQAAMTGGEAIDPEVALELFTTRTLGELIAK
jgi:DNA polymerase III delta subunit